MPLLYEGHVVYLSRMFLFIYGNLVAVKTKRYLYTCACHKRYCREACDTSTLAL